MAWRDFWHSPEGKAAIGQLFKDFGFFDTPDVTDPSIALRSMGQRDVLVRLSQLINIKPELAPDTDGEVSDILEHMLRPN